MMMRIGEKVRDFQADTNRGPIGLYDYMGDDWCVIFSHPKDFTPVCTTELGEAARLAEEFAARGCKLLGLSVDHATDHARWAQDIEQVTGHTPHFPMIADTDMAVSKMFGMLPMDAMGGAESRTAADNATVRTVFVIGADKTVKMALAYPMSTGRNFTELLRVVDSLRLTAEQKVATPVNWEAGEDVFILPSVADEDATAMFGTWTAPLPYMRVVPQPAMADRT